MTEGVFPKVDGDGLYGSEVNNIFMSVGDGSDGAFSESAGTTNLTQGTIYEYSSFLLDTNATLSASSTSTKPIIIKVQGDCTINGTIDLKGKGCAAATGYSSYLMSQGTNGGANAVVPGGYSGGYFVNFRNNMQTMIVNGTGGGNGPPDGQYASGGGGGCSSTANGGSAGSPGGQGSSGASNPGGSGGCSIIFIVGGNFTFGADSAVDLSGNDGIDGTYSPSGGGGAGDPIILHKGSYTDNGVAITQTGGTGGTGTYSNGGGGGASTNQVIQLIKDVIIF